MNNKHVVKLHRGRARAKHPYLLKKIVSSATAADKQGGCARGGVGGGRGGGNF